MRWSARTVAGLVSAAVVAALLPFGLAAPAQAAIGTCSGTPVVTVWDGQDLTTAVGALCPGDTLQIPSGTYSIGYLRFVKNFAYTGTFRPGTAALPITVTAQDPANPPLLLGGLQFTGADYWRISNLRVQATVANLSALYMNNGIGWVVSGCEFFGARQTNAMANVVISGSGGQPSRFVFKSNRVHGGAKSTRADTTDHNIYVNFRGTTGSGGSIVRNVVWDTPHGAGIKLGNGGAYNALGPRNVVVALNTIATSGRQILLHGNVSYLRIYGNLFYRATQRFVADTRTTQVYVHDVTGIQNSINYNYAYGSTLFTYDPKKRATYLKNRLSNLAAYNPQFTSVGTTVLFANNPAAKPYGAYGTGLWAK